MEAHSSLGDNKSYHETNLVIQLIMKLVYPSLLTSYLLKIVGKAMNVASGERNVPGFTPLTPNALFYA